MIMYSIAQVSVMLNIDLKKHHFTMTQSIFFFKFQETFKSLITIISTFNVALSMLKQCLVTVKNKENAYKEQTVKFIKT